MNKFRSQAFCRIVGVGLMFAAGVATLVAQVEPPQTKGVYGGNIVYIEALTNSADQTRLYVTTESANSAFYADVDFTQPDPFGTNLMFQAVPDLAASANHGAPNGLAVHQASGRLFVSSPADGILSCTTASNSLVTNVSIGAWGVAIEGSNLVYIFKDSANLKLGYGTLSADGATFAEGGAPVVITPMPGAVWNVALGIHPTNHTVYVEWQGTNIARSSDAIELLSAGTTFTPLALPSLTTNWTGYAGNLTFGFGSDGRIFVGGNNPANTNFFHNRGWELTYSDDNGVTWETNAITGGSGSPLWTTAGDASAYWVYNGSAVSTNKGVNWQAFGTQVPGSRVGSGRVVADPAHALVVYCDTEGGFGVCTNGGLTDDLDTIVNISRGIEAATINDFDLTTDKNIAWIAANGIRRATDFQSTPEWSDPKWPMGDGTCNYVAVDKSDTNGLTVYAGGTVLYKTTNGGPVESNPYNATNWALVFHPTNYGFGVNAVGVSAIEANSNIVALGLQGASQPGGDLTNKGGLYLSADGGSNWNEVVLHADGVDVKDLLLTTENGSNVVYAAVANAQIVTAYGVFRINLADTNVTQEVTDTVNMQDLAAGSDGRLYASGFDTQTNVVLYSKAAGSNIWETVPLDGYPTNMMAMYGGRPVITVGLDRSSNEVPYMLGNEWFSGTNASVIRCAIFYLTIDGTNILWETSDALRYPADTRINVMFWDDLVVGTSIGLYGQIFQPVSSTWARAADFDGDGKADPAMVTGAGWLVWLSSANYYRVGPIPFTAAGGEPAAGDFDGDGKADPAMVTGAGWLIWLSSANYYQVGPIPFTAAGGGPVAGDFDGDGKADPAIVTDDGWLIWLSSANYSQIGPIPFTVAGQQWFAVAGDFDGDGKADPAVVTGDGWLVWLSSAAYYRVGPIPFTVAGQQWLAVAGDFDGDRLADPAMVTPDGWYVWLSTATYVRIGPIPFLP